MQMPLDFPPVPKCFSHLLHGQSFYESERDADDQVLSSSLPARLAQDNVVEVNRHNYFRLFSEGAEMSESLYQPFQLTNNESSASTVTVTDSNTDLLSGKGDNPQDEVFDEDETLVSNTSPTMSIKSATFGLSMLSNGFSKTSGVSCNKTFILNNRAIPPFETDQPISMSSCSQPTNIDNQDMNNPFVKLNSSLGKLQKEMRELRLVDVNLFYQLINLHDSIQDLKLNNDRFSETGSECSLGSASYMGSMSSLDEESDWGESQVFVTSMRGDESVLFGDENRQSTSNLLEQITALTQKAEEDVYD